MIIKNGACSNFLWSSRPRATIEGCFRYRFSFTSKRSINCSVSSKEVPRKHSPGPEGEDHRWRAGGPRRKDWRHRCSFGRRRSETKQSRQAKVDLHGWDQETYCLNIHSNLVYRLPSEIRDFKLPNEIFQSVGKLFPAINVVNDKTTTTRKQVGLTEFLWLTRDSTTPTSALRAATKVAKKAPIKSKARRFSKTMPSIVRFTSSQTLNTSLATLSTREQFAALRCSPKKWPIASFRRCCRGDWLGRSKSMRLVLLNRSKEAASTKALGCSWPRPFRSFRALSRGAKLPSREYRGAAYQSADCACLSGLSNTSIRFNSAVQAKPPTTLQVAEKSTSKFNFQEFRWASTSNGKTETFDDWSLHKLR